MNAKPFGGFKVSTQLESIQKINKMELPIGIPCTHKLIRIKNNDKRKLLYHSPVYL